MSTRFTTAIVASALLLATSAAVVVTQRVTSTTDRPGYMGGGTTLLPNGWHVHDPDREPPAWVDTTGDTSDLLRAHEPRLVEAHHAVQGIDVRRLWLDRSR